MKKLDELIRKRFGEYGKEGWASLTPEQLEKTKEKRRESQRKRREREREEKAKQCSTPIIT